MFSAVLALVVLLVLVALDLHQAVQHCYWQLLVLLVLVGQQAVQHCYCQLLNPAAAAAVAERRAKGVQAEAAEAPRTEAKAAKALHAASAAPTFFLSWTYYNRTLCTTILTKMPANPPEESH